MLRKNSMAFVGVSTLLVLLAIVTPRVLGVGQVGLALKAGGTIADVPSFRDSNNVVLPEVVFNFDNNIAGNANRNVESQVYPFKLVGAGTYPASVDLILPGSCVIGTNSVNNSHVYLSHAGALASTNSSFTIADAALASYRLGFSAMGSYGDKFGAVSCGAPGSLNFTY